MSQDIKKIILAFCCKKEHIKKSYKFTIENLRSVVKHGGGFHYLINNIHINLTNSYDRKQVLKLAKIQK